jgi:hypothetical protein
VPGWAPPEDSGVSHYVYEKTRAYRKFEGNGLNCMSLRKKELSKSGGRGVEKRGGVKFEGLCHYVIENTYRKNVSLWASHYVDENTRLILL